MIRTRAAVAAVVAVAQRPDLWATAVTQLGKLTPGNWYRRAPFVPLPDARYLAFRFETAYGNGAAEPSAEDVLAYLQWCKRHPR